MIKTFSTLYTGHVLEGEGIGFNGTPHDDRWYSNDRLIQAFDIARETAQLLEKLDFDILWMAGHNFQREGYDCIPNLLILCSRILLRHSNGIQKVSMQPSKPGRPYMLTEVLKPRTVDT